MTSTMNTPGSGLITLRVRSTGRGKINIVTRNIAEDEPAVVANARAIGGGCWEAEPAPGADLTAWPPGPERDRGPMEYTRAGLCDMLEEHARQHGPWWPGSTWTDPEVLTTGVEDGWADPRTSPLSIDWLPLQESAEFWFDVDEHGPVNPCELPHVRYGRNRMGHWAERRNADAVVLANGYLLMIQRTDDQSWALPGGGIDPGETILTAAIRELEEETGLTVPPRLCDPMDMRYVPDPRASGQAWAVTAPVIMNLGAVQKLPVVEGRTDARQAMWMPASSYDQLVAALTEQHHGVVFKAHQEMLHAILH